MEDNSPASLDSQRKGGGLKKGISKNDKQEADTSLILCIKDAG